MDPRRWLWVFLFGILVTLASGCRATFPVNARSAERLAETFREQRRQGAAWFEAHDETELRMLAASAAQLAELLREGKLEPGAAFRLKDQELAAD